MRNNVNEFKEHLEKQLERVNSWLSFAEAKNAALIAFNIALLAVLAQMHSEFSLFCDVLMIVFVISTGISLWSFIPNTTNRPQKSTNNDSDLNLIFWSDIAKISSEEVYIEKTIEKYHFSITQDEAKSKLNIDIAKEIVINSRIALRKYSLFRKGLLVDIIMLAVTVILLVIA